MSQTVRVTIDGIELDVPAGTLVIRAAEKLGITIPRFCDHPLLDPVGACRQCLVEVEGQAKPFTSCTTTCTDGMVVKTHLTSDIAREGQEGQLEFLLINHPLDCPQCDKGGECPLQDQTLAHGPSDSRFVDQKRRFIKPIPISASVALDRERCVLCARCTRFSDQISGDRFIELFERGALEQVAIYEDEPYHSYFSGNVVQICPVGALTSTSYRFGARPFDLRSHDGICNQCSAGCNLRVDERRGQVQRQLARTNTSVNEMWNCDKGRYGYEFVAHPERLQAPAVRNELGNREQVSWTVALRRAADGLRAALDHGGPQAVGVLTGGRLADEDAYALGRFARDALGTDNIDFRLRPRAEELPILSAVAGTVSPTYADVENADVVVIAGLDTREEVPILHLRLRKAWRRSGQKVVVVGPALGGLEEIAWRWIPTAAGAEAAALAELAGGEAAGPAGNGEAPQLLDEVIAALVTAEAGLVLAGERLAASPGGLAAAAALARRRDHGFAWVPRRSGARGAVDAGLAPGLLPGGRRLDDPGPVAESWSRLPEAAGLDARGILDAAAAGTIKALYLVGVDPAADFEDPALAQAALEAVDTLIVQDLLPTRTSAAADVVLPAAAPHERVGSFPTGEGRRQPFTQAVPAAGLAQEDWDILRQLAQALGADFGWETAADVRREAAPLMEAADGAEGRVEASTGQWSAPAPAAARGDQDWPFAAVTVPRLIGEGTTLAGADELKRTARPLDAEINDADAQRLGIAPGEPIAITGPGGRVELPAQPTSAVAGGCVILPETAAVAAALAGGPEGGPARVRIEAAAGELASVGAAGEDQRDEGDS
ncbi:MAG TPA: NADH-quinone oxidoreductase subunit G [Egibacteraceae bacterium]|nr:NADH-quinone oxidoreductase subunit G [Egibacteraceae bacterium]